MPQVGGWYGPDDEPRLWTWVACPRRDCAVRLQAVDPDGPAFILGIGGDA